MCRIKRSTKEFRLLVNEEIVKVFRNKKMLDIYIKSFKLEDYNVEVN